MFPGGLEMQDRIKFRSFINLVEGVLILSENVAFYVKFANF